MSLICGKYSRESTSQARNSLHLSFIQLTHSCLPAVDWISVSVRSLLASPLQQYTNDGHPDERLDYDLYVIIATTKESIATERKRLGNYPPFPPNFDNEPFCDRHNTCKRVWTEKWFTTLVRRIHHPTTPLPLSLVPEVSEGMDHRGTKPECKRSILESLLASGLCTSSEGRDDDSRSNRYGLQIVYFMKLTTIIHYNTLL